MFPFLFFLFLSFSFDCNPLLLSFSVVLDYSEEMTQVFDWNLLACTHSSDFRNVYEPAEDSWLLVDVFRAEANFLHSLRPSIVLEIGTGSGVLTAALANALSACSCSSSSSAAPSSCPCSLQLTSILQQQHWHHVSLLPVTFLSLMSCL